MGKIRVKTLGIEELEEQLKQKERVKKEQKKARKTVKAPGLKGGERVVAVGPTEEELARLDEETKQGKLDVAGTPKEEKESKKKQRQVLPRARSASYKQALVLVDRNKTYLLKDGLELLKKVSFARFDGTVELHINTIEKGLSGQITFPHATGKDIRVAIATDKLIEDVAKGKVDFDILLAHPQMMPKLARVAKTLGPRGLMPNPKSGTISEHPEKLAEKYKAGQTHFRTEVQAPIIHLRVGKVSMGDKALSENIKTAILAIGPDRIKNITLKSTMSPGIKVAVS